MILSPQEQLIACKAVIADVLERFECSVHIEGNELVIVRNVKPQGPRVEDDICPLPEDAADGQ